MINMRYKNFLTLALALAMASIVSAQNQRMELVWSDEFDGVKLDESKWGFEEGFVRNHEYQWYSRDNVRVQDGLLIIEARMDTVNNPGFEPNSTDWRGSHDKAYYTSSCINTRGKYAFTYGRMEVRARIPAVLGSWPAIWTLGDQWEWPSGGEIDIMEFYHVDGKPHILANAAWGNDRRYNAVWNTVRTPFSHFTDRDSSWSEKFHVWALDWTKDSIIISLDGEVLNQLDMSSIRNGRIGEGKNPFDYPQYILLNLAVGGDNGGQPQPDAFPMKYEIDYVRVYQNK